MTSQYIGGKGSPVYQAGIKSGGNTTTTPLGASETFTGDWELTDVRVRIRDVSDGSTTITGNLTYLTVDA